MAGAWARSALLLVLLAGLAAAATTTTTPADPPPEDFPATPVADTTPPMEAARELTAAHLLKKIFAECVRLGSFACVKPKVLSFLSSAAKKDKIFLTEDMSIERTSKYMPDFADYQKVGDDVSLEEVVRRADKFLAAHQLKLRLPKELVSGSAAPYVPKFLLRDLPAEVTVPLADNPPAAGQEGFIKRIVMPFLLGLKFKATALVPLALALIALKTWKALTLGLLSLVMSGAMLAFKLTKPKVVNYEVYHYPQHDHHTAPAAAAYDPHHGWGRRSLEAADIAYRGYLPATAP